MTTTKRLLIMLILMNLVLGSITTLYNDSNYDETKIQNQIAIGEEYRAHLVDDAGTSKPIETTEMEEATRGNSLTMTTQIFKIFLNGLAPFPFHRNMFNSEIERLIVDVLKLFNTMMWVLIGYEIIAFFKNKKTD